MNKLLGPLLGVVIGVGIVGLAWAMWPPKTVYTPPEIVTRWDTIAVLDTAWIDRVRIDTINLTREVLVQRTDTVLLARVDTVWALDPIVGINAVSVGEEWGDTTRIAGFKLTAESDTLRLRRWQTTHFTAGPLGGIVVDSIPPLVWFHPMPPDPCRFGCKAKIAGIGGLTGAAVALLLVLTLGG